MSQSLNGGASVLNTDGLEGHAGSNPVCDGYGALD